MKYFLTLHRNEQQSSQIFVQYLLEYPMGNQRVNNHIHQIVLNIKYEFEDGRLAAIELLSSVIQKFPVAILDERCQFFFLPLVLQLVNDDSKKCKEAVSNCMHCLLQRLSTESVKSLFGYAKRWSQSSGANSPQIQMASAQLFGIFVDSRPDYVKRGGNGPEIVSAIYEVASKQNLDDESGWELLYHMLICTEKLNKHLPSLLSVNYELWAALVNLMVYPHPWVMLVSSRIISSHLSTVDPNKLLLDEAQSFVVKIPGCLYKIASNSCRQLDVDDVHFVEATSTLAIKAIIWAFRAMKQQPNICYDEQVSHDSTDGKPKDPCLWVITRLSNIAKPRGILRRSSIFKCFAGLCQACNPEHLSPYLELMIDPIDRAIREASNRLGPDDQPQNDPQIALPKDVLEILEETFGTEVFVKAFAEVNHKAREKRDKRKQDMASEAVHDPTAAAQRKIKKQLREKERRKRKVEDVRSKRFVSKKCR
jgi:U3 small nucleolar RNA-associated protein 20